MKPSTELKKDLELVNQRKSELQKSINEQLRAFEMKEEVKILLSFRLNGKLEITLAIDLDSFKKNK